MTTHCSRRGRWMLILLGVLSGISATEPATLAGVVVLAEPAELYSETEIDAMVAQIQARHLGNDPYWLRLLHYSHGLRGHRSRIDDPRFFLAATGADDPEQECIATLRAVCRPTPVDFPAAAERFPARLEWLIATLPLARARLSVPSCAALEQVLATMPHTQVSLVHADASLASPGSIFGHTMLVLSSADPTPYPTQVIAFTAYPRRDHDRCYAWRGVFGGHPGYVVSEAFLPVGDAYLRQEHRALWAYVLDLDQAATQRLLRHLWELRSIWSAYWFLDENCSHGILTLLEVARPDARLLATLPWWTIPVDALRAVQSAGLIRERRWQPAISEALSDPAFAQRLEDLVRPVANQPSPVKYSEPGTGPESGHGSLRVSLGFGATTTTTFAEFRLRPVMHDLLDYPRGFPVGFQLGLLDTTLRWYADEQRLEMQQCAVVTIRSVQPGSPSPLPNVWLFDAGLLQQAMGKQGTRAIHARLRGGAGIAVQAGESVLHSALTMETRAGELQPHYAVGPGLSLGAYIPLGSMGILHPHADLTAFSLGDRTVAWTLGCAGRLWHGRNCAVSVDLARHGGWDWVDTVATVRVDGYF